jgi:hypothetical protein
VQLFGSGRLARDLLPWLSGNPVTLVARDPARVRDLDWVPQGIHVLGYDAWTGIDDSYWVLAAPVSNAVITEMLAHARPKLLLDFRGEEELPAAPNYLALRTLYASLEENRLQLATKRREALAYAAELVQRRREAVVHRPYGWEDAFA